jgi:hypothetical protein
LSLMHNKQTSRVLLLHQLFVSSRELFIRQLKTEWIGQVVLLCRCGEIVLIASVFKSFWVGNIPFMFDIRYSFSFLNSFRLSGLSCCHRSRCCRWAQGPSYGSLLTVESWGGILGLALFL